MILVAGGTGRLGQQVVSLLSSAGLKVRVLTRMPEQAQHLKSPFVEIAQGDVRDLQAVERAAVDVNTVVSAIHGFPGTGTDNPHTVDWQGNSNLIRASLVNGVEHFILVSIQGVAPEHPMELFRMKYKAERELRAAAPGGMCAPRSGGASTNGLDWTIVRPTAYMELWAQLVGEPLLRTGKTLVFGRGNNPINFVSVCDVARFVELAVTDRAMRGRVVEVGGPQNLSMQQFARCFQVLAAQSGAGSRPGKIGHVPLPVMRTMSVLMRGVSPRLARQIQSGVVMDTWKISFDAMEIRSRYPSIPVTSLDDLLKRDYHDSL